MANEVSPAFIRTFQDNVRFLAQQGRSYLRPWVQEVSAKSAGHRWDRLAKGAVAATPTINTHALRATPNANTAFSGRLSTPKLYDTGNIVNLEEPEQMLIDPNSAYVRSHGMTIARAFDQEIINAAVGTSKDEAGGSVAFVGGQSIGSGATAFSFDLVTEVSEKFMTNDIDPMEQRVFVIGPKQARRLLQMAEVTSGDYNALRPLQSMGYVENWMGYTWIVHNGLTAPAGGELYCFAMTKSAIGLQVAKDYSVEMAKDPTQSFAWRLYGSMLAGAVRVEDEQLVRVHVANS
jgi:hypothetical protein